MKTEAVLLFRAQRTSVGWEQLLSRCARAGQGVEACREALSSRVPPLHCHGVTWAIWSFSRLVLASAGPHQQSLQGCLLEEPRLSKAFPNIV